MKSVLLVGHMLNWIADIQVECYTSSESTVNRGNFYHQFNMVGGKRVTPVQFYQFLSTIVVQAIAISLCQIVWRTRKYNFHFCDMQSGEFVECFPWTGVICRNRVRFCLLVKTWIFFHTDINDCVLLHHKQWFTIHNLPIYLVMLICF